MTKDEKKAIKDFMNNTINCIKLLDSDYRIREYKEFSKLEECVGVFNELLKWPIFNFYNFFICINDYWSLFTMSKGIANKTEKTVMLSAVYGRRGFQSFDVFIRNGVKFVFYKGGEFIENKFTGNYEMNQNNNRLVLTAP